MNRSLISDWLRELQDEICRALELADGSAKFKEDIWKREAGGGGRSMVLAGGKVIEKGGVMFSAVEGEAPAFLFRENAHGFADQDANGKPQFYATGLSIVIHPENPMVPIIHMNTRYFELCDEEGKMLKRWLGGGIDLTPHYIDGPDAVFFHGALKTVCDTHDPSWYTKFKTWADDYFYIPHRNETRGIGGIFFDKLGDGGQQEFDRCLAFWKEVGRTFAPVYTQLIKKNKDKSYGAEQKSWQLLRRGRYVEFNLLYDKGTKFGLESNGRVESILVSLPRTAGWEYNYVPAKDSEEDKTQAMLRKGINWLDGRG